MPKAAKTNPRSVLLRPRSACMTGPAIAKLVRLTKYRKYIPHRMREHDAGRRELQQRAKKAALKISTSVAVEANSAASLVPSGARAFGGTALGDGLGSLRNAAICHALVLQRGT